MRTGTYPTISSQDMTKKSYRKQTANTMMPCSLHNMAADPQARHNRSCERKEGIDKYKQITIFSRLSIRTTAKLSPWPNIHSHGNTYVTMATNIKNQINADYNIQHVQRSFHSLTPRKLISVCQHPINSNHIALPTISEVLRHMYVSRQSNSHTNTL